MSDLVKLLVAVVNDDRMPAATRREAEAALLDIARAGLS